MIDEQLEQMIDARGLAEVLTVLDLICAEKAVHLRANWQDETSAGCWDVVGKRIQSAARFAHDLNM